MENKIMNMELNDDALEEVAGGCETCDPGQDCGYREEREMMARVTCPYCGRSEVVPAHMANGGTIVCERCDRMFVDPNPVYMD